MIRAPPNSTPFPYTPLFRSQLDDEMAPTRPEHLAQRDLARPLGGPSSRQVDEVHHRHSEDEERDHSEGGERAAVAQRRQRSEEHTSELQSRQYLVCRLLLEK